MTKKKKKFLNLNQSKLIDKYFVAKPKFHVKSEEKKNNHIKLK